MGLTRKSVGKNAAQDITDINKKSNQRIIALVGNPNVGKSTLFNAITGMHQHTGNWPGKTVTSAIGKCTYNLNEYIFVDLPGCYSLKVRSPEEEVARDFICSKKADLTVVVCDATALERNLNLVLQIKEITDRVVVCVNLMDEAKKKNIDVDLQALSQELSTTVVGTTAFKKNSVDRLLSVIEYGCNIEKIKGASPLLVYPEYIENAIEDVISRETPINNRSDALQHIEQNIRLYIDEKHLDTFKDDVAQTIAKKAEEISHRVAKRKEDYFESVDYKTDRILTGKVFGFLSMLLMLVVVFWITITGANYLSDILNDFFVFFEEPLYNTLSSLRLPVGICDMLVYGIYRVLTWIISVMLPPMAIFFPLFTLLEDVGFLPRIAFNLDKCFNKCNACGKQALTMCMGFGCNAAGVVGCRIIESKRERLIAIITNAFVPCNGRFPAIISVITMFFIADNSGLFSSVISSFYLTLLILLGVFVTLITSKLLSKTILKGLPSSFTLELPSYRKPQVRKIIVRSILDRTLFVLGRAVCIAAPAGLLIWLFANITVNDVSLLVHISDFLDPFGRLMGLDGVILTAFIMGFPANEIVLPLIMMIYTSNGVLSDVGSIGELKTLLAENGWTIVTAINTILFMLMHWPCSTTCLTVRSETKSWKWTLVSFITPTIIGILVCVAVNLISKLLI